MALSTVLLSPIWPQRLTNIRMNSGKMKITAIGREKSCSRCAEYWPADSEFFYTEPKQKDGLSQWCKACYREWRKGLPAAKDNKLCIQ